MTGDKCSPNLNSRFQARGTRQGSEYCRSSYFRGPFLSCHNRTPSTVFRSKGQHPPCTPRWVHVHTSRCLRPPQGLLAHKSRGRPAGRASEGQRVGGKCGIAGRSLADCLCWAKCKCQAQRSPLGPPGCVLDPKRGFPWSSWFLYPGLLAVTQ